ncbi:MAG: hydroxypyruvate reductase [endosymbiont of Seepiophila jonesi]|uniref:Hydroxypyruvate reductase n=1 Tax=endosymbiont of Lamellibrachia luymesi TaxID=2200907 RepID=A0A370DSV1_9GAMM|nr:MAG: hydroxypyruvate reductase [endosymbiont of Lamellibrachia luymesi]RDH89442.1 MAG: hydroxypyruvate reductase [endosymbiont of Seepiophila jonesi]
MNTPHKSLLEIFDAALRAVDGRRCVRERLRQRPLKGQISLVAMGKAAGAMATGAREILGERIVSALVISKHGHLGSVSASLPGWELFEAGHPLPDSRSLAAGDRLITFLQQEPERPLLFLLSGGASSLVESPVDGVGGDFLVRANRWLLGSGLAIGEMNRARKALSRIKGGGLLHWVGDRPVTALAISDVPGDEPDVIGSGLLVPEMITPDGMDNLSLPDWLDSVVRQAFRQRRIYGAHGPVIEIIANLGRAKAAAAREARKLGYRVTMVDEFVAGDATAAGVRLADELKVAEPGVTVWGGETTVVLPPEPGQGGRNQHLALAAAGELQGQDNLWFLAAGTDGTDGSTEDEGALVDGATLTRARNEGFDPNQALRQADSGSLLEASGDLVTTGPTGTNVMDLMLGLKL